MLLHIARVLLILFEVLILFNLLIVVHELGHFLAARWRGLYIEKFGVWFGQPFWKKKINGVQYSLGSLPFGGFGPAAARADGHHRRQSGRGSRAASADISARQNYRGGGGSVFQFAARVRVRRNSLGCRLSRERIGHDNGCWLHHARFAG